MKMDMFINFIWIFNDINISYSKKWKFEETNALKPQLKLNELNEKKSA